LLADYNSEWFVFFAQFGCGVNNETIAALSESCVAQKLIAPGDLAKSTAPLPSPTGQAGYVAPSLTASGATVPTIVPGSSQSIATPISSMIMTSAQSSVKPSFTTRVTTFSQRETSTISSILNPTATSSSRAEIELSVDGRTAVVAVVIVAMVALML